MNTSKPFLKNLEFEHRLKMVLDRLSQELRGISWVHLDCYNSWSSSDVDDFFTTHVIYYEDEKIIDISYMEYSDILPVYDNEIIELDYQHFVDVYRKTIRDVKLKILLNEKLKIK